MERVLLTGATGFIGQELLKRLSTGENKEKYEVHALQRYVTGRYSLDRGSTVMHYANLTDYSAIKRIIKDVLPDYVLHIAAISPVSFSFDHYVEVGEVDYIATTNLAETCYREVPNFKQFLFASTSETYGLTAKTKNDILTEDSMPSPNSPYAVAKAACDMYLRYMGLAYDFPYTLVRPFNTYGRKDNTHFFIERTITQMLKGESVNLGDPAAVRDWVYVDDHVDIYLKALGNKKAIGQAIQACSGKGYTTKETAEIIAKLTGYKGSINWNATPPRHLDAKVLIGDNRKAKELIGWTPKYTLEEGLKKTIEYWRTKSSK